MASQKCRNMQFMTSYYISDTFMRVSLLTNSNILNHTRINRQTNKQTRIHPYESNQAQKQTRLTNMIALTQTHICLHISLQ